jgi:hypothetical protein
MQLALARAVGGIERSGIEAEKSPIGEERIARHFPAHPLGALRKPSIFTAGVAPHLGA